MVYPQALLNEVAEAILLLQTMPRRYPLVDDEVLALQGIRVFSIKNYLVFYAIREERNTVVIERFLFERRAWNAILKL